MIVERVPMILLNQCIAVLISLRCSVLSEKIDSSQFNFASVDPMSSRRSCQVAINCPTWFFFNPTTCNCECLPYNHLICDGDNAFIEIGFIVTYNKNRELISIGHWQQYRLQSGHTYNITKPGFIKLPMNLTELNDYMCAPLNRNGFLCSKCRDDFGPSVNIMLSTQQCYKCRKTWTGVVLYLFLEFVPITMLFVIILVFRIRVTSAPMTCFIMYSQLIMIACYNSHPDVLALGGAVFTDTGTLRTVSKVFLTLYGVLNLDFFQHSVPPFCISSHLELIHVAFLGYFSAFYPIVLVILTWMCIELHDRNCQVIVHLWKPFHVCFVRLRRSWDIKSDIIDAFASLFLLSFCKILYQACLLLSTDIVYYHSWTGNPISRWHQYVLKSDPDIKMGSPVFYVIYFSVGLIYAVFSFMPSLILTLYPFKIFRVLLARCKLDCVTLSMFVEKFHCCYRDGLDRGKDMRAFSGLYFLVRILVIVAPMALSHHIGMTVWFIRGAIFLFAALIVTLCRPYKKTYMNVSDALLLSHLVLLCHFISSKMRDSASVYVAIQMAILTPFAIFLLLLIIWVMSRLCNAQFQRLVLCFKSCLKSNTGTCAEQQRLNQPIAIYGTMDEHGNP